MCVTRPIEVQGAKADAFVLEFADEVAPKIYTDSPAQKEWDKTCLPIHEESTPFGITS